MPAKTLCHSIAYVRMVGNMNFFSVQLFRVSTSAMNVNLSAPVVFTVRSERYVQTWRIPLELPQYGDQYNYTVFFYPS